MGILGKTEQENNDHS